MLILIHCSTGTKFMPYALLADLTLLLHAAFILFVVLGGVLVFWRRGAAWLHIPCALWGALIEFRGWVCPLTYLENSLRAKAGASGYSGDFIGHYLVPLVYPEGLTSDVQIMLGMAVVIINAVIYTAFWNHMRARSG
jgi:hypothetical protein